MYIKDVTCRLHCTSVRRYNEMSPLLSWSDSFVNTGRNHLRLLLAGGSFDVLHVFTVPLLCCHTCMYCMQFHKSKHATHAGQEKLQSTTRIKT